MWSSQIVILLINSSVSISGDFCLTPLVRYFITSSREISCSSLLRSLAISIFRFDISSSSSSALSLVVAVKNPASAAFIMLSNAFYASRCLVTRIFNSLCSFALSLRTRIISSAMMSRSILFVNKSIAMSRTIPSKSSLRMVFFLQLSRPFFWYEHL